MFDQAYKGKTHLFIYNANILRNDNPHVWQLPDTTHTVYMLCQWLLKMLGPENQAQNKLNSCKYFHAMVPNQLFHLP